jgi:16S rRNA (guanine966-N2)-methyltransferase
MRVIAGALKGRVLQAPTWDGLRPTSDRLRETLFNILAPRIEGARVLDVCAGTGAVGIEALSRGASAVTFVESDRRASALIEANLRKCGVTGRYTVDRRDARVDARPLPGGPFDIVFLDPPYAQSSLEPWVAIAAAQVAADGVIVLEHASRLDPPVRVGDLHCTRRLRQGDSALAFYTSDAPGTEA